MLKKLFWSICIFLSLLFSGNRLLGADYFSKAISLFNSEKYFAASVEFERAIFYSGDNIQISDCIYYKSLCYKRMENYHKAVDELGKIDLTEAPDSLWVKVVYEKTLCSFLDDSIDKSIRFIKEINSRFPDSDSTHFIVPLTILCTNSKYDWHSSLSLWSDYIDKLNAGDSLKSRFRKNVDDLYNRKNIPWFHSPDKSGKLSMIIPGAGQIYCGAVSEGIMSLLINTSLASVTALEFYSRLYLTGNFVGSRLFGKFYFGGVRRARTIARERNKSEIAEFNSANNLLMMEISKSEPNGR
jgi:hypothetical protein